MLAEYFSWFMDLSKPVDDYTPEISITSQKTEEDGTVMPAVGQKEVHCVALSESIIRQIHQAGIIDLARLSRAELEAIVDSSFDGVVFDDQEGLLSANILDATQLDADEICDTSPHSPMRASSIDPDTTFCQRLAMERQSSFEDRDHNTFNLQT